MIVSVARAYNWTPNQIADLSLYNEDDMHDLEYWYNDALEVENSLKNKPTS
jgi:hypothetical protein